MVLIPASVAVPMRNKNIVGPQVRRLRNQAGLSQAGFAAECQRNGWDISRDVVAGIEGQVRCVTDLEYVLLAKMLRVPRDHLLPKAYR